MTFLEEVMMQCKDIWVGYLEHPFLKDIRSNTMDEEMFKHYLIEDTIYLKAYAKVFALGLYKSNTMEEMRLFYDLLKVVESNESAARVKMLREMGCDVEKIENKEPSIENKGYMDFLHKTAEEGTIVDILFATLPCMLSYAYIGKELMKENPNILKENQYHEWIYEYVCDSYVSKCKEWSAKAEELSHSFNEVQKQHLQALFHEASIHEMKFWDMSYRKVNESEEA